MEQKSKNILLVITVVFLIVIVFGAAYAYFVASVGTGASAGVNVTANTTDSLMFEVGNDLSININQQNFGEGAGNQSDSTTAKAILLANNKTNTARYTYNLYLHISKNEFIYTTEEQTPEILLQVTKPDGTTLNNITGLNYVTVGDTSGFDITTKKGLVKIALDKVIEVLETNTNHKTEEEWTIGITFVNLDSNQQENTNKRFTSKIIIQQEAQDNFTFADFCDEDTLTCQIAKKSVADNIQSEFVTSPTGINFNQNSSDTNGKGVYTRAATMYDEYPIYYYRGAVTDNNIKYANFCWKIVRTTETGGTKLIYNGEPDAEGKCTNTTGTATQLSGTTAFNSSYTSPADVGYMYGTRYTYSSANPKNLTGTLQFGSSVTYDTNTKTYSLTEPIEITPSEWESKYNTIDNNHYTFLDSTDKSKVYYVYYTNSTNAKYITLTEGKKVEDAIEETFDINPNQNSSTIKTKIDNWYKSNIENTESEGLLEDTIWCNDRSIRDYGGWNPNGGSTEPYMYFSTNGRTTPTLECSRVEDRFTKDAQQDEGGNVITNGALDHAIGLLTADEVRLAGGTRNNNSSYYLYTNSTFWLASPSYFDNYNAGAFEYDLISSGYLHNYYVFSAYGARPSVSLATDVVVTSGDGSSSSPFEVALTK